MMDLSDGLAVDAPRLARASQCGLLLELEQVPCNEGCTVEQAVSDGEDFELLVAVSPVKIERLQREWREAFPLLSLSIVGSLTEPSGECTPHGRVIKGGYDHFQ
jgi:thiamine-monophosphate kinase